MREFVFLLWQITLYSTVTAAALILLKRFLKFRISPALHAALWLILLIRLLFPILPSSRLSVYNLFPAGNELQGEILEGEYFGTQPDDLSESTYIENLLAKGSQTISLAQIGEFHIPSVEPPTEESSAPDPMTIALTVLVVMYWVGVAAVLLHLAVSYSLIRQRTLACSIPCTELEVQEMYLHALTKLRISKDSAPPLRYGCTSLVLGVFHPVILLDSQASDEDIPMILVHELNHYRHGDNWLIFLSNIISGFLWFNPLIWTARTCLRDDIEVLCDSRTLKLASVNQFRYASLLYRSTDVSAGHAYSSHISAEGALLKTRLRTIAATRRRAAWEKVLTLFLCLAVVISCLTNPLPASELDYSVYIENGSSLVGNQYANGAAQDQISGIRFFSMIYSTLKNRTGGERSQLVRALGDGSLKSFTVAAVRAGVDFPGFEEYMNGVAAAQQITYEQAAVVVTAVIQLVSNGKLNAPTLPLPKQIRESTLVGILQSLPLKEAKALLSCYNRGNADSEIAYARCYTVETIVKIMSSIANEWLRMKFISYYYAVPIERLSAEEYAELFTDGTQYDYVYMLCPDTLQREERAVQDIVAITRSGVREDVFYLKSRQDKYPFEYIRELYRKAGFDRAALHEEYAALGYSEYAAENTAVGWYSYGESSVDNFCGQPDVDAAVRSACQYGLFQVQGGLFPYGETVNFGETMHILCLLYAGMTSE